MNEVLAMAIPNSERIIRESEQNEVRSSLILDEVEVFFIENSLENSHFQRDSGEILYLERFRFSP